MELVLVGVGLCGACRIVGFGCGSHALSARVARYGHGWRVSVWCWLVCGEVRKPRAKQHIVDGVVSLCQCAALLKTRLQLVRS